MKVKVEYHYAKHDVKFLEDCYETKVFINGKEIDLPFEADYPAGLTDAYVQGMLQANGTIKLESVDINDLEI